MSETITVKTMFTESQLQNLLCCAMEGGIGYWASIAEYIYPDGRGPSDYTYRHLELPLSVNGGAVVLVDACDEGGFDAVRLDRQALKRGMQIMAEKYPWHYANFANENADAETGDAWVQCSVFGEIVFG